MLPARAFTKLVCLMLVQVSGRAFKDLAEADPALVLYRRGERSATFTLILQGRVLIHTGSFRFF